MTCDIYSLSFFRYLIFSDFFFFFLLLSCVSSNAGAPTFCMHCLAFVETFSSTCVSKCMRAYVRVYAFPWFVIRTIFMINTHTSCGRCGEITRRANTKLSGNLRDHIYTRHVSFYLSLAGTRTHTCTCIHNHSLFLSLKKKVPLKQIVSKERRNGPVLVLFM